MITQKDIDSVVASLGVVEQGDWKMAYFDLPDGSCIDFIENHVFTIDGLRHLLRSELTPQRNSIVWRVRPTSEVNGSTGETRFYLRFAAVPDYVAKWCAAVNAANNDYLERHGTANPKHLHNFAA